MRKFVFAVILMLAAVFILSRLAEVSSIADTLRQADGRFILLACFIMLVWVCNTTLHYWTVYRAMGISERLPHLGILTIAAYFVNVVTPTGGMSGIAVYISEARRKGISRARVTVATAVVTLFDYLGFTVLLALGLFVLFRRSRLDSSEIFPSVIMLFFVSILGILLYTGMRSATALGNLLASIARRINRLFWPFLHREYIVEYRAHEFAHDAAGGLQRLRYQPSNLILPILLAFNGKVLLMLIFLCTFLAFNVNFSSGTIIAGWSISYLFSLVSPTPGGVGIFEGLVPLFLTTLWVPLGAATVITLAYRGVTFWLPLLFGVFAFRWLMRVEKVKSND